MNSSVVVVDDDSSILELMLLLLESEDYRVRVFESGMDAYEDTDREVPDAYVVDLMMPGMNGVELIQALRANERTRDVPILVCSAYYGDLRRTIQQLGHDNIVYLRKPFQIEQLLDVLGRLVTRRPISLREYGFPTSDDSEAPQAAAGF